MCILYHSYQVRYSLLDSSNMKKYKRKWQIVLGWVLVPCYYFLLKIKNKELLQTKGTISYFPYLMVFLVCLILSTFLNENFLFISLNFLQMAFMFCNFIASQCFFSLQYFFIKVKQNKNPFLLAFYLLTGQMLILTIQVKRKRIFYLMSLSQTRFSSRSSINFSPFIQ